MQSHAILFWKLPAGSFFAPATPPHLQLTLEQTTCKPISKETGGWLFFFFFNVSVEYVTIMIKAYFTN